MDARDADQYLVTKWFIDLRARQSHKGAPGDQPANVPDAEDEVLAILLDGSDPARGWRLVMRMLQTADGVQEIRAVAIEVLETLLRDQGDALVESFGGAIREDQRLRVATRHIYLSGKVAEIARAEGLYP